MTINGSGESQARDIMAELHVHMRIKSSDWVYRGRNNADHKIIPSICHPGRWTIEPYNADYERKLSQSFIRTVRNSIDDYFYYTDLEILALGQHYGLPTRLVDWTRDLITALYFAVGKPDNDDTDGAIIMVMVKPGEVARMLSDPFEPLSPGAADPVFYAVAEFDLRIRKQRGLFSLHRNPEQHWEPASNGYKTEQIIISKEAKPELRKILKAMRFTEWEILPSDALSPLCTKFGQKL